MDGRKETNCKFLGTPRFIKCATLGKSPIQVRRRGSPSDAATTPDFSYTANILLPSSSPPYLQTIGTELDE